MTKRFWEIDFLRSIAIIMMVIYHGLYVINDYGYLNFDLEAGFWGLFGEITAILFILLVGVSLSLSYSRHNNKKDFKKFLFRGIKIFSWGLIITFITWIFLTEGFIIFGVLHFIGLAIILAYPFLKYRFFNLFLGINIIMIGLFLQNYIFNFKYLLWLGFVPNGFYTLDYFPILPWFGFVLVGIFLGNSFYPEYKRLIKTLNLDNKLINQFNLLGQNSLKIYLLHIPVLIFFFLILGLLNRNMF